MNRPRGDRRRALRRAHGVPLRARALAISCVLLASTACASAPAPPGGAARPASPARLPDDTVGLELPPAGYGTLRQDDISIRFQARGVQVSALPLDEAVIRLLSSDSYRTLRGIVESRRRDADAIARRLGAREYRLWLVSFHGLEPEARFSPMELYINSAGRDFRPIDVVPLTPGFGEQRLVQRQTQSALFLFDGAVDVSHALTVTYESVRNAGWNTALLQRLERERALARSRSAKGTP